MSKQTGAESSDLIPIGIRVFKSDLIKMKRAARAEGLGYQTWLRALIHKIVTTPAARETTPRSPSGQGGWHVHRVA